MGIENKVPRVENHQDVTVHDVPYHVEVYVVKDADPRIVWDIYPTEGESGVFKPFERVESVRTSEESQMALVALWASISQQILNVFPNTDTFGMTGGRRSGNRFYGTIRVGDSLAGQSNCLTGEVVIPGIEQHKK